MLMTSSGSLFVSAAAYGCGREDEDAEVVGRAFTFCVSEGVDLRLLLEDADDMYFRIFPSTFSQMSCMDPDERETMSFAGDPARVSDSVLNDASLS